MLTPEPLRRRPRRRHTAALVAGSVAMAVCLGAGGACSSTGGSGDGTTAGPAPGATTAGSTPGTADGSTYEVVTDAQVTEGLAKVRALAAQVRGALATSQADAEAKVKEMYDVWFTFEGTVRKNEKKLYLQMEDGLAALKSAAQNNKPEKIDSGLADLEAGATAYLKAHP